eukprot:scaffold3073_cov66-Cylindrotheca_fusiformis.AAC.10
MSIFALQKRIKWKYNRMIEVIPVLDHHPIRTSDFRELYTTVHARIVLVRTVTATRHSSKWTQAIQDWSVDSGVQDACRYA